MFCISMYSEGINTKLHPHYKTKCAYILKLIIFYHGYIYRISVCFIFLHTMKVSILNYTCITKPSVHSYILELIIFYHGYIYRFLNGNC